MPLDPENLIPSSSINRVRIVALPGVAVDEGVQGNRGLDLLCTAALAGLVRSRASGLKLGPDELLDDAWLPHLLQQRLAAGEPAPRPVAEEIASVYGRRLGYLLATLKRGDAVNRAARPDCDETYWAWWAAVRRVWLGGGLSNGRLGRLIAWNAAKVLLEAGVGDCEVIVSAHPSLLALIGAARAVSHEVPAAAVFDFGNSHVKRGVALFEGGRLKALEALAPVPSPGPDTPTMADTASMAEGMARLIADTWLQQVRTNPGLANCVVVALASYLRDNHPLSYLYSGYPALNAFTDNLGDWLSDRVAELARRPIRVELMHDGTAAAQTYAGTPAAAVITLGTFLGVGFPWTAKAVRGVTPDFRIDNGLQRINGSAVSG